MAAATSDASDTPGLPGAGDGPDAAGATSGADAADALNGVDAVGATSGADAAGGAAGAFSAAAPDPYSTKEAAPSRLTLAGVLTVALVAVSFAAIFIRLAAAPAIIVALYRMLIAAVVMLPVTLRALARTPIRGPARYATVAAGALLAMHFATWISSLSFTTVAASVTLAATSPLWAALIAWLVFGLAPTLSVMFGVLLAVAGAAIIGFGDLRGGTNPLLGDALALTAGAAAAGYLVLGRSVMGSGVGLAAYAGTAYGVAALLLAPLPLLFGLPYLDYPLETFAWVALLALIPQLIGHTGLNYAAQHLSPTLVATTILAEPLGAGILALLLFQEVPTLGTLLGALVLLMGVVLTIRSGSPEYVGGQRDA
ncbi:MAG TPA: DMT family transporter [Trueperaceae bacterium]|nr:DMT family transporter [Trueperaceae bacterium]